MSQMNDQWDISLYGDSLKEWKEWVSSLRQQEWLLRWAMRVNKAVVIVSIPAVCIARVIGIPLQFLDLIAIALRPGILQYVMKVRRSPPKAEAMALLFFIPWFTAPLRILLWPLLGLVLRSCNIWTRVPATRLILLVFVPIAVILSMILISLIPYEPDIREKKYRLCELWPLSQRRLGWIATYGTGKFNKSNDEGSITGKSNESNNEGLIIGRNISLDDIEKEFCRVIHFIPFATLESGKIEQISRISPYASLLLESQVLRQEATLPIIHKDDFKVLWGVFKERGINSDEEVLIVYERFGNKGLKKSLSPIMPSLHVWIYQKGHLEKIYDFFNNPKPQNWKSAPHKQYVAEWHPTWYK